MLDEPTRTAIALKKFSIISPILNGQVERLGEYCSKVADSHINMPHYGMKRYSPKTISSWYTDYMRHGIDSLKPSPRSDMGGTRKVTMEIADELIRKRSECPKAPITVIYKELIEEGVFTPAEISLSTVTRFFNRNKEKLIHEGSVPKDIKRFAHGKVNQLWQTDVMYGPYIKNNGKKSPTYLLAYIDDCSRLILHAQFFFSQDFLSLRSSFREAILRRGIPKMLYTDNGKIYRCASFEYLCANLGVTLLRAEPFTPNSKGKIERFFRSLRQRFLSVLDLSQIKDIDQLNESLWKWLETDYNEKIHSAISNTPLNLFLSQAESINMPSDLSAFNEKFLVNVQRTVKHDATLSLNCVLYETGQEFAGRKLNVKYDPELIDQGLNEVFLYDADKCIGLARKVKFEDNAHMKRKGKSSSKSNNISPNKSPVDSSAPATIDQRSPVSFFDLENTQGR